jgi:hypothetical protein
MDNTARGIGDQSGGDDVERRTGDIRRDIEQTRGDMSETIEAIEDKLRPGNILSSATERVKHAATEKVRNMTQSAGQTYSRMRSGAGNGSGLMAGIRQNPIPSAMIGIGAAWLLMRSLSNGDDDRRSESDGYADPTADSYEYSQGEMRNEARARGRRIQSQLQRVASDNPLMLGAGALLLGSVVGLAIPETQRENDWLGDTRDSMLDKAQEVARNTAARAQETAADLAGEAAGRIVGAKSE